MINSKKHQIATLFSSFGGQLKRLAVVTLLAVGALGLTAATSHAETNAKVAEAMAYLKSEVEKLGAPSVQNGEQSFGTTKMNNNFTIVDDVKAKFGSTATLFAAQDGKFVRISTNVMKDGARAVGTNLDPAGPAFAAAKEGNSFYGIVEILGKLFDTGYEPVKDAAGAVVGVLYVGYAVE